MKKLHLIVLTLIMVFSITACQPKSGDADPDNNKLEGSLESILDKIYETADTSDDFKEYAKNGLQTTEIKSEDAAYFLGKDGIEFESAIASEPLMSSSAYSLCLVRVKEGADIEKIKTEIKENVDPRKWICVGVDPSNVIVDNIGDVIVLIMSDNEGSALHDAFLKLKEK
ncbi:hypothetical protein HZF24_15700 [Sedimentibacter hydroxybenzoicus DSM 7310]|uniref:DUF4358 domain-containing protein n=1 Tax=Sedimentibacter hydroxybenzoicus DSM 7310 TaxID=1123245 RepID=A0A974GXH2_SEDHY|nr:hypothetical protein [Sedimentibacter hydroxybenzoicus]NYB75592.1 hypothetical protein [Sedimentibacter hydroxybenzoicus DSM 7310]